jgi:NAD(P)-dependent dehydrogenase (short-subunit alcohol dehydrogenase family)
MGGTTCHGQPILVSPALRLFEETVSAFGRMHVLVANSGLRKDAAVADMTLDDWRTVIDIIGDN